jgi:hypothetical protein
LHILRSTLGCIQAKAEWRHKQFNEVTPVRRIDVLSG